MSINYLYVCRLVPLADMFEQFTQYFVATDNIP